MRFPDYESAHDSIELPYNGEVYELRKVPAVYGLPDHEAEARGVDPMSRLNQRDVLRELIGPDTYARMIDDNVPDDMVTLAALVSMLDWKANREEAEKAWLEGPDPELIAALTAAVQEKTTEPDSTVTESGDETPTPASTNVTKSRKTSSAKSKAKRSPGRGSSSVGG